MSSTDSPQPQAEVWFGLVKVKPDRSVEMRKVKLGVSNGSTVQVLDGLQVGDTVIERGSLFIDRVASGDQQ